MKIANKYFKGAGLLTLMTLLVFSCTEFVEFESTTLGPGPTITLSLVSTQDSTFTVSVTSNADGYASVILLPGSGNVVPDDPEDLLTGNIASLAYQTQMVTANQAANFTFEGLVQWALYEVQSAANNGDGKISEVKTLTIGTDDNHGPVLSATDPGIGYSPALMIGGPVTLVFDEMVVYDDSKDLTFTEFYDGQDVVAASVEVDGNMVTITPGEEFSYYDYVMLSYPEGAFTDYAGNATSAVASYFDADAGELVGLFWGVESHLYEAASITPEADSVASSRFNIVVTFDDAVDASGVEDGMITLTYDDGIDIFTKGVLASEVNALENTLTITQTRLGLPGSVVTLLIPEEILEIGYGNPNAEITASWAIK
jgi:hypothetical protein